MNFNSFPWENIDATGDDPFQYWYVEEKENYENGKAMMKRWGTI
ncbi:hypothetical protein [Bifidobacterium moukalabense]|nr:hypothetical protein [Bifidobacterium moukalabense]